MHKNFPIGLIAVALEITGFVLIANHVSKTVAVGVFLMIWGANMGQRNRNN